MRLSIKEKAGIVDTSRIFETGHLTEAFLRNVVDDQKSKTLENAIIIESEKHLAFCEKCRRMLIELEKQPKEGNLPL